MNSNTEPRFIITHKGDTFRLFGVATNGDVFALSAAGTRFLVPFQSIRSYR